MTVARQLNPPMSSTRSDWRTPRALFHVLQDLFGPFDLDPCTTAENPLGTKRRYTPAEDGLTRPWPGRVFANPPYGREIGLWIQKAAAEVEAQRAELVVVLVPVRTDARWWGDAMRHQPEVCFLQGRLTFEGGAHPAPFSSALLVFRPRLPARMAVPR